MTVADILAQEKIVPISELQKNPAKALDAAIVRITKSGKEVGIFMSKKAFEDFIEEHLDLTPETEEAIKKATLQVKQGKVIPLNDIL